MIELEAAAMEQPEKEPETCQACATGESCAEHDPKEDECGCHAFCAPESCDMECDYPACQQMQQIFYGEQNEDEDLEERLAEWERSLLAAETETDDGPMMDYAG